MNGLLIKVIKYRLKFQFTVLEFNFFLIFVAHNNCQFNLTYKIMNVPAELKYTKEHEGFVLRVKKHMSELLIMHKVN